MSKPEDITLTVDDPSVIPVVGDDGQPTVNVPAPEIDFVVEDENAGPDPVALQAQLDKMKSDNEALRLASDQSKILQDGFLSLGQQFQGQQQPTNPLPNLSPQAIVPPKGGLVLPDKTDFNEKFFTDPQTGIVNMLAPILQAQQSQYDTRMGSMNKMLSKQIALNDEGNKALFGAYSQEIEQYATSFGGEDPYSRALNQVRANHFVELQNTASTSAVEKALEEYKAAVVAEKAEADKLIKPPVGGTTLNQGNPVATKVKITPAQMKIVESVTATQFGADATNSTKLEVYEYLKRTGQLG